MTAPIQIVILLPPEPCPLPNCEHDAYAADRYDALMRQDPLTRTDEEEVFIEHMAAVLGYEEEQS